MPDPRLPTLFVSHGSPMFAIETGTSGPALTRWGAALRANAPVKGVVVLSPHWMSRSPAVMTTPQPATWHDFGGFPQALYELQYPAPGDAALGSAVRACLSQAGIDAQADATRPMDHGAWVPLMHLFPDAGVPVVQVALPAAAKPRDVWNLGRAVRGLRDDGILVIGSGSMTHNLREFFGGNAQPEAYVSEFSRWVEDAVSRGDAAALMDYRQQAPGAARAHPTDEHFLPIFFALGAADDAYTTHYLSREVMGSILAMDAFSLGSVR